MKNEKVSVNINHDKLAAIDLLIDEGLVVNRSAFINEAIDLLIQREQGTIDNIITQRHEMISPNQWFIGLMSINSDDLLKFKSQGVKLTLKGFGSLYINKEVACELIIETIDSISKWIKIHCTDEQRAVLNDILKI